MTKSSREKRVLTAVPNSAHEPAGFDHLVAERGQGAGESGVRSLIRFDLEDVDRLDLEPAATAGMRLR